MNKVSELECPFVMKEKRGRIVVTVLHVENVIELKEQIAMLADVRMHVFQLVPRCIW